MSFKNYLVATLLVFFFAGCHEATKKDSADVVTQKTDSNAVTDQQIETRESFFYRQTMDIHNEVMAKMGKLNGYKKRVQQQTDSIKSMLAATDFPRQVAQRIAKEVDSLKILGKKLQAADSSMNAWMDQFNPDPKLPTSDAKADYFEKQKQGAEAMKKIFFEALEEAEKKFNLNN